MMTVRKGSIEQLGKVSQILDAFAFILLLSCMCLLLISELLLSSDYHKQSEDIRYKLDFYVDLPYYIIVFVCSTALLVQS